MLKAIFIFILVCALCWCYQNWETIKVDTIDAIQNEKTIKKFNINKETNKDFYDYAISH